MKRIDTKRLVCVAAAFAGILLTGSAAAWYGVPGSGAMTYERQTMMRSHGYVMRELADMLEGRQLFNRAEAVRLAREIEAGLGDNLVGNYRPGSLVAGSRTAPWTWRHFDAFRGYAEAARQSSARLAEALNKEPAELPAPQRDARGVPPGPGYGRRGDPRADFIAIEAFQEYGRLNATCHSCHMLFRGGRW